MPNNKLQIGLNEKTITSDLSTITIGDERSSLEVSTVNNGARVRGNLEVTGQIPSVNTNRKFIGIEQDENYFKIAEERINKQKKQLKIL